MKASLIILLIGLTVVACVPRKPENRSNKKPCHDEGGVEFCTCDDADATVVYPVDQESCFTLGFKFASCNCNDGETVWYPPTA